MSIVIDGLVFGVLILITTFDFHLRVNQLNIHQNWFKTFVSKTNSIQIRRTIFKYMIEHNRLCIKLNKSNQFWKNTWLLLFLTCIPCTLTILHQVLFEELDSKILKLIFITVILIFYSILFFVQFFLASLSTKIHKMCKTLSRIQWNLNSKQIDLRFKLKVMTYFERLTAKKRIGIAMSSLTVFTFQLFAAVCNRAYCNILII